MPNDPDDAPRPAAPARSPIPIRLWITGTLLAVFGVAIIANLARAVADEGDRPWTTDAIFAVIWVALVAAFARDVRRERLRPSRSTDPDDT